MSSAYSSVHSAAVGFRGEAGAACSFIVITRLKLSTVRCRSRVIFSVAAVTVSGFELVRSVLMTARSCCSGLDAGWPSARRSIASKPCNSRSVLIAAVSAISPSRRACQSWIAALPMVGSGRSVSLASSGSIVDAQRCATGGQSPSRRSL